MTFEELSTVLCQVECCLNSRPLVPLHSHAKDGIDILTPGHFLVGRHTQALPEFNFTQQKIPLLCRWSLCQAITQHFWKRWSGEYLQHFSKWKSSSTNLQVDDLVLIKEDSLVPATRWPMGRAMSVSPGKDGLVRVATIQTKSGIYKRPIAKLVRCSSEIVPPRIRSAGTITLAWTFQSERIRVRGIVPTPRIRSDPCLQLVHVYDYCLNNLANELWLLGTQ